LFSDPANLPSELPGTGLQARCRLSIFCGRPWGLGSLARLSASSRAAWLSGGKSATSSKRHTPERSCSTTTDPEIRIPLKSGCREPMAGLNSTLDCGRLKRRYRSRISRVTRLRSRLAGTAPALCRCPRCHDQPSALPHQAPCLPLKASVRRIADQNMRY
jgi:hypothetical protein